VWHFIGLNLEERGVENFGSGMCEGEGVRWIYDVFGDCIVTTRDMVAFAIGLSSNLLWICSAVPQIYQNCVTKRVRGQHPFFIGALLMGDILSLIGILLTHGLANQIITNTLYVILDGTMVTQFVVFNYCCSHEEVMIASGSDPSTDSPKYTDVEAPLNIEPDLTHGDIPAVAVGVSLLAGSGMAFDWGRPYRGDRLVGTIFGWLGCFGYMLSGEPQIHKNIDRQSVDDVSPFYLGLIICGNGTYTLAVMLRSMDPNFLWQQTPFILGSIWPMLADIIVSFQFCYYRRQKRLKQAALDEASEIREPLDPSAAE
jgi:hypothetical protein